MTRNKSARSHAAEPAVVVFGLVDGVPRAAWFAERDVQRLAGVSLAGGCHAVPVDAGHKARVAEVPRGRIGKHGSLDLPAIDRPLYDELQCAFSLETDSAFDAHGGGVATSDRDPMTLEPTHTASARVTAPSNEDEGVQSPTEKGTSPVSRDGARSVPALIQRPGDWDEISVGSLVLTYDPASEAWYEAIVIMPHGDRWLLRWRDYPEEGTVARGRPQIALMHPYAV